MAVAPRCYWSGFDEASGEPALLLEDLSGYEQEDDRRGGPRLRRSAVVSRCSGPCTPNGGSRPGSQSCDFLLGINGTNTRIFAEGHSSSWASFLRRYGHVLPPGYEAFRPPLSSSLQEAAAVLGAAPRTLVHLDFRADNLFFGGDPLRTVAIDWQLARRGPGVADLATFFCHSIATDLRREVEGNLLRLWHDAVVRATATSYSFDQDVARNL